MGGNKETLLKRVNSIDLTSDHQWDGIFNFNTGGKDCVGIPGKTASINI